MRTSQPHYRNAEREEGAPGRPAALVPSRLSNNNDNDDDDDEDDLFWNERESKLGRAHGQRAHTPAPELCPWAGVAPQAIVIEIIGEDRDSCELRTCKTVI